MKTMYQQINLYQPIFRKQRQIFSAVTMLQAAGVVAIALMTIYLYGFWRLAGLEVEVVQLEGREKAFTAQLDSIDPDLGFERRQEVEEELERLNATLLSQQRLIEVLREQPLGSTSGFSANLAALARQHSDGLWLTAIVINGASGAMELAGQSVRAELIPEYLLRLGEEEALSGQLFDRLEIDRTDQRSEVVFRVTSRAVDQQDWQDGVAGRER